MNEDTKKLLNECHAGTKMAVENINQLLPTIHDLRFREGLEKYRNAHLSFGDQLHSFLEKSCENTKEPSPISEFSAKLMTGMRLMLNNSDKKVAALLTDGCNMGIKSLSKYLNQYSCADKYAKEIAGNMIRLEESMMEDLRVYL